MSDVQKRLILLHDAGWTYAAVADELGYARLSIARWRTGEQATAHPKPVLIALDALLKRRPPKQRRYPGTHHLQRARSERERQSDGQIEDAE